MKRVHSAICNAERVRTGRTRCQAHWPKNSQRLTAPERTSSQSTPGTPPVGKRGKPGMLSGRTMAKR